MTSEDRIAERLVLLLGELPEQEALDAVLLFLAHLGLDDPSQLSSKLRTRLAAIAGDPSSIAVRPELLERIAGLFADEKVRSLEEARAKMGASTCARKEPPKPIDQRTTVVGILALKRGAH